MIMRCVIIRRELAIVQQPLINALWGYVMGLPSELTIALRVIIVNYLAMSCSRVGSLT